VISRAILSESWVPSDWFGGFEVRPGQKDGCLLTRLMILKATVSEGWVPSDSFGDSEGDPVRIMGAF
jgi:hypothetical protein